jgi:hypothetical protein
MMVTIVAIRKEKIESKRLELMEEEEKKPV